MTEPVIRARELRKQFSKTEVLHGITFDVLPGRIVGLVGPNGSGKTTTINAIVGLTDFDGELQVLGRDPRQQRSELMQEIAYISDVAILPRWIRMSQLLDFMEGVHPRFSRKRALYFLEGTKITPDMKVETMSKGMVAQLHVSLIMAIDARLLILDEPTLGLDIIHRKKFYRQLLDDYSDGSRTIFLSTHQIDEIESVVTDLLFLHDGQILLAESRDEIERRYIQVTVAPDRIDAARTLSPIYEQKSFGKTTFIFEDADAAQVAALGQLQMPSLSDLFMAKLQEEVR